MAYCEQCNTPGLDPRTLVVAKRPGTEEAILVGPCCSVPGARAAQQADVEYGLELSSHYGFLAYARAGGLKVEYRRTPNQLKELFG